MWFTGPSRRVHHVRAHYMIVNEKTLAATARYVSLTPRQLAKAKYQYNRALTVARG